MKANVSDFVHKGRGKLGIGLLLTLLSVPAVAVPLLLEGPITAISANPDGSGSITVLGVVVGIPAGTSITTPTAALTMAEAAGTDPLPGRTQPGFLGGTAIIEGDAVAGVNTATSLFMEPAENILGADVTSIPPAPIEIAGVTLAELTDPRIPADPFMNDFGFEVDPATVPTGTDAVAEGYFSNDGSDVFQYFAIAVAAGTLVNAGQPEISITRAQCRAGAVPGDPIELRVQGAVHDPAVVDVTLKDYGPTTYATQTTVVNADNPTFGDYGFVVRNIAAFQICPASVTAEFTVGSPPNTTVISTVAAVDGGSPDADGDGVEDVNDNCTTVANGPLDSADLSGINQRDTDGDGFGNICDADFNQNNIVDPADFSLLKSLFGSTTAPDQDLNGNGIVDPADFSRLKAKLGQPPGS